MSYPSHSAHLRAAGLTAGRQQRARLCSSVDCFHPLGWAVLCCAVPCCSFPSQPDRPWL